MNHYNSNRHLVSLRRNLTDRTSKMQIVDTDADPALFRAEASQGPFSLTYDRPLFASENRGPG